MPEASVTPSLNPVPPPAYKARLPPAELVRAALGMLTVVAPTLLTARKVPVSKTWPMSSKLTWAKPAPSRSPPPQPVKNMSAALTLASNICIWLW